MLKIRGNEVKNAWRYTYITRIPTHINRFNT
jgi:hypothetical protein